MTAYISDFGIAKILAGQNSSTLTATLGTTRYIAPGFEFCQREAISALASLSNVTDQWALLSFTSLVTKDPYNVLSNWNSSISFCDWNGVSCSRGSQRVVTLKLFERHLKFLSFEMNQLTRHLPKDAGRFLLNLKELYLGANNFDGPFPPSFSNATSLQILTAEDNKFSGPIPLELGSLTQLRRLCLWGNMFTNAPGNRELSTLTSFTKCRMVKEVYLSKNLLNGILPVSIGNLTTTWWNLDLSFNEIEGTIPLALPNLTKLIFSSALPPALCELKDLIWLYLQDNSFTGLLPLDVGNLVAVDKMDVSVNQLSGELPVSLSELQRLEYLNLSKNSFDGHIPGNLDGMVNIKIIDLSHNKLCGGIPKSLENLQQLQVLDLSFNRLEGAIPSGGNFTNLSIDSFVGNYALCGAPKFHVPVCSDGVKKHNIVNMIKVDIFLASGVFALLLIVWILIFVAKYRKTGLERHYHEVERFHGIALPVITYKMLSQVTNNFSNANFMGTGSIGSVYKGILAYGTMVAVKVNRSNRRPPAVKSKVRVPNYPIQRVDVMGGVHHSLHKDVIKAFCKSIPFKADQECDQPPEALLQEPRCRRYRYPRSRSAGQIDLNFVVCHSFSSYPGSGEADVRSSVDGRAATLEVEHQIYWHAPSLQPSLS
ncbi:receptor kinase-like protein Xa21 [Nymphaea colorata]|nr:receptor kinase-like protein Xa21 [Nymphaea colorata]